MCIRDSLVGAGNQMLEAGGVGGVTGDGYIHALGLHDGHALVDVVSAIAADLGPLALGAVSYTHLDVYKRQALASFPHHLKESFPHPF